MIIMMVSNEKDVKRNYRSKQDAIAQAKRPRKRESARARERERERSRRRKKERDREGMDEQRTTTTRLDAQTGPCTAATTTAVHKQSERSAHTRREGEAL